MKRDPGFWTGQTDLAPVALFRIVYGLLAFNWFWQLLPNLGAFYSDEGMFPRSSQVALFPLHFTLLNTAGETWQIAVLWLASLAATAALAAGFHGRTAAFVTFAMMASFSLRNPLVGDASDQIFRASAFWLGFTAAGDRYSVDEWRRTRRGELSSGLGWALPIRILELQFAWVYLATGLEKMGGGLWRNGLAVFYSLQLEHTFARPWAAALARNVDLTRIATDLTLTVELAFLPLVTIPLVRRVGRIVALSAAAGLHLSILAFMNVGNFPLVMLAGLIPFLSPHWVHGLAARLRLPDQTAGQVVATPIGRTRLLGGAALVLLAFTVFSTSLPAYLPFQRPEPVDRVLRYADLVQKWNMFSPDPPTADGWLRIPALLADGTRLDLVTGGSLSEDPLYADPFYSRWTKVTEWIASRSNAEYRQEYSRMYCRMRNLHPEPGRPPLVSFELVYYERVIAVPGATAPPIRVIPLSGHRC